MVQDSSDGSDVNKTVNLGSEGSDVNKTVNIGSDTITLEEGDQADAVNTTEILLSHIENVTKESQELGEEREYGGEEAQAIEVEIVYRNIDEIPFEKTEIPIKEKIAQLQDQLEKSMTDDEALQVSLMTEVEALQTSPVKEVEVPQASPIPTVEDPQISFVPVEPSSVLASTIDNQSNALNKSAKEFELTVEKKPAESTLNEILDIASPNASDVNQVHSQDTSFPDTTFKASPVTPESPVENQTEKSPQSTTLSNNSTTVKELYGDQLDTSTPTVASELSTPETVKVDENKQMSERTVQNITLPSVKVNNTFFDTMESRFDVEFKMPAVPVFKSQSDVPKDDEFKTCGSSCKKTIIRLTSRTCVRRRKVHFNTRKNLTAYNINKSCWCMCVGCVVTE